VKSSMTHSILIKPALQGSTYLPVGREVLPAVLLNAPIQRDQGGWVPSMAPMQPLFLLLSPTTEPSPATENSTTATTPWKSTTACPEDGPIKRPSIKWVTTRGCIIRCPHTIRIWTIASVWHSAETSASTGHWTLTHWSCSIKSWHTNTSLSVKLYSQRVRANLPSGRQGCRISEYVMKLVPKTTPDLSILTQTGFLTFTNKPWTFNLVIGALIRRAFFRSDPILL
jgi:hypothetical protein